MGGGLPANCGRKNIGFLTPFGTSSGIKKRHRHEPTACRKHKLNGQEDLLISPKKHDILNYINTINRAFLWLVKWS